ncbi:hypothetical protein ACKKBG_A11640 [Auxenochlorella protothecoides x Auxenochlorella symbiontica]
MGRQTYNRVIVAALIILSGAAIISGACDSTFVALPSAILGAHVEFLTEDSATAYCKRKGFSKAGSVRTSTLNILGLSMSAARISPTELVTPRSTKVIVAVECLKPGQTACTADSNGNIGSGNKGKRNFGTNNVGNDNIATAVAATQATTAVNQTTAAVTKAITAIAQSLPSFTHAIPSPPKTVPSFTHAIPSPPKTVPSFTHAIPSTP